MGTAASRSTPHPWRAPTSTNEPQRAGSARAQLREIFARAGFRRYFAARAVSQLGDGLFQLAAVAVLLFEHPGKNPTVPLFAVSAVTLVPFSLIGPLTGVFIDRWERRKILVYVPIGRALVAALLPVAAIFGKHSIGFYAIVLIVLSANRFFLATMSAVLPQLVPEEDLIVANSAATTGGSIANVSGEAIGSGLATLFGGVNASVVAAGFFVASAIAALRIPVHPGRAPVQARLREQLRRVVSEMRDGVRAVRGHPRVVFGLTSITVVQFLVGGMVGVLTYYLIHTLGLSVGAATPLLIWLAAGIGVGVVLVPIVARRIHHDYLIAIAFAMGALANGAATVFLSRNALVAGAAIVGISYAFGKIPVDTLVQEEMADELRGRAFTVYDMLFNVARVAGIGVVALAYASGVTTSQIVGAAAVVYAAGAAGFAVWSRRVAHAEAA